MTELAGGDPVPVVVSQVLGCLGVFALGWALRLRIREGQRRHKATTLSSFRATVDEQHRHDDSLWWSVEGLRAGMPDLAIDTTLTAKQREALLLAATVTLGLLVLAPNLVGVVVVGAVILLYSASLVVRLILFSKALNNKGRVEVTDEMAAAATDLPTYTVLVPAYGEPSIIEKLVTNLRALDYPSHLIEILLLLEEDDTPTVEAAQRLLAGATDVKVVLVPAGEPRTKPKALNYGLAVSTGEIVTIYDAEDRPDPSQLRKAAVALAAAPANIACVQARLDFFNPTQNLLTKWFTLDYRMWFTQLLPGLSQLGGAIPLGGTSNHFRREALLAVGAWDPFNVTEDADLGVRLHRQGYRTGVVDSVTYEEANSDFINWIRQRSRWYKGYIQTALVHLREPVKVYRELGPRQFLLFVLFVGGTPLIAILNPIAWLVALIWFVWHPHVILSVIPTVTYFLGMICWVGGNLAVLYSWMLSTRQPGEKLWLAALLSPFYWVMMSVAAVKALIQLISRPSYWEKTEHGLAEDEGVEEAAA